IPDARPPNDFRDTVLNLSKIAGEHETQKRQTGHHTATTACPCYLPVLGDSAGAGRAGLPAAKVLKNATSAAFRPSISSHPLPLPLHLLLPLPLPYSSSKSRQIQIKLQSAGLIETVGLQVFQDILVEFEFALFNAAVVESGKFNPRKADWIQFHQYFIPFEVALEILMYYIATFSHGPIL